MHNSAFEFLFFVFEFKFGGVFVLMFGLLEGKYVNGSIISIMIEP